MKTPALNVKSKLQRPLTPTEIQYNQHERWNVARSLVVRAAHALAANFNDPNARRELLVVLEIESTERAELEALLSGAEK